MNRVSRIRSAPGLAFLAAALLGAAAIAAPPRLEVTLHQQRIYKGESVILNVDVLDVEPQGAPDVSALVDFVVEPQPDHSMNSSMTVIVNGRRRDDRRVAHRFPYLLTPKRAGVLEIPAIVYLHDGEEIRSSTLKLEVIAPQAQEWVRIGTSIERKGTRPLQPVTIRMRLFVKKFPPPNDAVDPVSGWDAESPRLRIPWAIKPPDGLEGDTADRWLAPLRSRRERGFSINEITFQSNDLFSMLEGSRLAVFSLGGRAATEADLKGFEGVESLAGRADDYFVYELARTFTPTRPGDFELGAISIQGEFAAGVSGRTVETTTVFDEGKPIRFAVDDAPIEGRPASFAGAFGRRFSIDAAVTPDRGRVGDPLALTLRVRGDGNLAAMGAPELSAQPGVAAAFKVERSGSEFENGVRTFQYVLRANAETVREIPALEFSWFDVDANAFASTRSAPISVTIDSVSSLGSADIVTGAGARTPKDDLRRADGLFGNRVDPGAVGDERVDGRAVFVRIGLLAVAYAALSLAVSIRDRRNSDPARVRRRGAVKRMNERLAAAADSEGAAEPLQLALLGLVADVAGLPDSGLTGKEALKALAAFGVDETTRGEFTAVVDAIDGSRFGGGRIDPRLVGRARELALRLATELERLGRLR